MCRSGQYCGGLSGGPRKSPEEISGGNLRRKIISEASLLVEMDGKDRSMAKIDGKDASQRRLAKLDHLKYYIRILVGPDVLGQDP